MARDEGLETVVSDDLAGLGDLRMVKMFGGVAWMWRGNLLCGCGRMGFYAVLARATMAGPAISPQPPR